MKFKFFISLLSLSLFASCSFNKIFLCPDKSPAASKSLRYISGKDTNAIFFSHENHQPTFIKNGRDTIDHGYAIESVVFKSENGNNLNGWILTPKNLTATITLLHFHGNAGSLLSQYQLISPLVKNGFRVFMFDYSGFGFSEGNATKKNVLTDANSALNYLKSREDVKNTKIIIYGQSLGGHLAAVVAAKREKDIDGLVIEGAFSSHKDIAASKVPVLGRLFVKQSYSAARSIKEFHKPVLIIHSSEDKVIPISMGKKIFSRANSPKEFYEIKQPHILGPIYYAGEISGKIKSMPDKN